jgi:hypothetical protein
VPLVTVGREVGVAHSILHGTPAHMSPGKQQLVCHLHAGGPRAVAAG